MQTCLQVTIWFCFVFACFEEANSAVGKASRSNIEGHGACYCRNITTGIGFIKTIELEHGRPFWRQFRFDNVATRISQTHMTCRVGFIVNPFQDALVAGGVLQA